jgi:hypothetical protein
MSYWSGADVLTQALVYPHLDILSREQNVEKVIFFSIERGQSKHPTYASDKVNWMSYRSKAKRNIVLTKISDFFGTINLLKRSIVSEKIDLIVANSPLSGGLAYLLWCLTGTSFAVVCFEPHHRYMVDAGVWKKWSVRYLVLNVLTQRQKRKAWKLITVTQNYRDKLIREGVPGSRIMVMPSCVDTQAFAFRMAARQLLRSRLGIDDNSIVGIYVGKFGGLYYSHEAFALFRQAFDFFGACFRLVVLTPDDIESVKNNLLSRDIDLRHAVVLTVPHNEVSDYLCAADFAFATIKPNPSTIYCSAVKIGEYWANGLPVMMEKGVGDDSGIVQNEGGGVLFTMADPRSGFSSLAPMIEPDSRAKNAEIIGRLAYKHRRLELTSTVLKGVVVDFYSTNR